MEKIQANMIIEILGRPKENIMDALNGLLQKLSTENGVHLKEKTVHEPVLVENQKDLFTTFAEIHLEFDSLLDYFVIMFSYMPSHIEIIYPEKLTLKNEDLTFIGNKMLQRLHDYDSVVKNTLMEKEIITRKLFEVAPHLFKKDSSTADPVVVEKIKEDKAENKKEKKGRKLNKEKETKELS